jgi:hypothetical protein
MLPRQPALIIVQNLPVPLDRRLWLECQALRDSAESSDVATIARTHPVTLEPNQLDSAIGARRRVQNVDVTSMLNADLVLGNATNTEPK